ncbi:PREDICTED: tetratricopeptide repeat protein 27 [Vollenhovia emeryi]|uniref:tetratricopeptide repeat protein 27 n=1 Tax=Vollenhovia emeryi TaxID=411798 RepID=UPI0005F3EF27|nr:PREDICTED: tetratricopeptide repeat protein 27 [Vollenhovia emeryi]
MASRASETDRDIEIELLLNFSRNEDSNVPHNVRDVLNGQYENAISEELPALVDAGTGDSLEQIVRIELSRTPAPLSWLCAGVAALLHFVQCNWTGPPTDKDVDWLRAKRDEALKHLSLHDECNINIRKPELLYLAQKIFSNTDLQLKYPSCVWWLFRATFLHQRVLEEDSGVLFEELENLVTKIHRLHIVANDPLCRLLFTLEVVTFYQYYTRIQNSEEYLESAQTAVGIKLHLEGAMGKRTKYQQEEKAQLYLKIEVESNDTFPSIACKDLPKALKLNDEVRLEDIEFSERKEVVELGMMEEAVILARYFQLLRSRPKDHLTDEEIKPYLTKVIDSTRNWTLKMNSLCYRCFLESTHKKTVERSMLQLEFLLKDHNDAKAPVARRMDLFFASGMKPVWILEEKWAELMVSLGLLHQALEVFTKLKVWEQVIYCYSELNLKHKAAEIIEQEISKKPTVNLWCLLGDTTGNVSHYETAWRLSGERSSRVQRHWGHYYFNKKDYAEAIPHLKLSVELNNIQTTVWFRLGYAALQVEDWKLAATAYRRYCDLEETEYQCFEAWNNLAKAYIKLGDKPRAWKCLQDAIKCNYNRWEVWDNLMIVSIDLGHFSEVIRCYHRILDLKNTHSDVPVLKILTNAIINNINDSDGNPASRLLKNTLELFGRITSNVVNNADLWRMYAELLLLRQTDVDNEKAAQCLQQAHRFMTSNSDWWRDKDTARNVLELCCSLAQTYLCCTTDSSSVKKRRMLGSAKLSLQGVVKRIQAQEWDNEDVTTQLTRVEQYLATIISELEQIKHI